MKSAKLFVILLVAVLLLTACGPAATPVATEAPTEAATEAPVVTEAPTEAPKEPVELRFTYYADGVEADVIKPLVAKFMAENPYITVVLDVVPYKTIDEQLPVQVETGEGPDLARITNFGAYKGKLLDLRTYMADAGFYEANFPAPILTALGFGGYPDALTITGPYVNKTLFDQAGIEIPGEGTTWEEWTKITKEVKDKTGADYAISVDRTGQRIAGPAMSMGATLLDADGNFTVDTPGFRAFVEIVKGWHDTSITPVQVWLSAEPVNSCIGPFKTGKLVMCMSGSWQINGLVKDVGDTFDWVVVPNPTGAGGSTGIAGGSAVVGFAATKHPQEVAMLIEFLIKTENYSEFSAGTLSLPAHKEVAAKGVAFKTENPAVLAALTAYTSEVSKLTVQATSLNVNPYAFAYYR
ncbi:MAG: extracellular solute-binding protein, partial [Anaerolineaceae bacterium]|nr:extracellular solute-binding protein [Anaerolineaceae bacterium]